MRSKEQIARGQVLWTAVSVNDPPRRHQRILDVDLFPVLLDISAVEDIELRIDRVPASELHFRKALRLCEQARAQGGLFSNCNLAELLSSNDSQIAHALSEHERSTNAIVPRRATLHDVGT
jgi:hypothetical protein